MKRKYAQKGLFVAPLFCPPSAKLSPEVGQRWGRGGTKILKKGVKKGQKGGHFFPWLCLYFNKISVLINKKSKNHEKGGQKGPKKGVTFDPLTDPLDLIAVLWRNNTLYSPFLLGYNGIINIFIYRR